jgi:hypothetical protein
MHPVQAEEAYFCAERQHQEHLARAARDHLVRSLHPRPATANGAAIGAIAHPVRLATVVMLLLAVLAVAAV